MYNAVYYGDCSLESEKTEMFEEQMIIAEIAESEKGNKQVSLLSQLLEDSLYEPSNPYIEYAKFDGEVMIILFVGLTFTRRYNFQLYLISLTRDKAL